ncbi:hypothetical protein MO973_37780 [Paenibacillus sp. TRM 82003]|nr:hypothetical protein [Paenibacillus sp. TRM 82003]
MLVESLEGVREPSLLCCRSRAGRNTTSEVVDPVQWAAPASPGLVQPGVERGAADRWELGRPARVA